MPRNDFLTRPAPESEDDLEVPGQPFLGLLGILSEYYKYREPLNKQGRALGNALKYLYRVKKREVNGTVDENFGLEILDAVEKVVVNKHPPKTSVPTTTQGEASTADRETSSKERSRAPVAQPPPDSDTFSDFGFSTSSTSSDELGSKINDLVAMVKSKVKKKKKKKKKYPEQESVDDDMPVSEPIPKLKIRFGKQRSGSEECSSSEDVNKATTDSPMKLTIKLGNTGTSPLLPPPPLLTLHKLPPVVMSPQPSSPKYEPASPEERSTVIKLKRSDLENEDEKPPIKLTLRVAQPMRNAKGWISPRTEQLVNYIDNVTTFVNESAELGAKPAAPELTSPKHPRTVALPEPPKLKLAPTSPLKRNCKPLPLTAKIKLPVPAPPPPVCRKRKRESSPKHPASTPTPKEVMEEVTKPTVPPLKFPKSCLSNKPLERLPNKPLEPPKTINIPENVSRKKLRVASASSSDTPTSKGPKLKKRKNINLAIDNKDYWQCGIFSNSLKQDAGPTVCDELDFRSNILPIYCGINYLRKQSMFMLPYDLFWVKENGFLPKKEATPKRAADELDRVLKANREPLPTLSECEYVFDEHIDKPKKKGRRGRKKGATKKKEEPVANSPGPVESLSSPCDSLGLVIQSDCDSPLPQDNDPLAPGIFAAQTSSDKTSDEVDSPAPKRFVASNSVPHQSNFTESCDVITQVHEDTPPPEATPPRDLVPPRDSTPPQEASLPRGITPPQEDTPPQVASLREVTPPQEASPLREVTPPQEASPLREVTPPQEASPLRAVTPPQEASPLRAVTPPQEASPLHEVMPPQEASPLCEVTPPQDASPLREVTPPQVASSLCEVTPPLRVTPPQEASPLLEVTPPQEASPLREVTPPQETSPLREVTPPQDASPLREVTPPRDISPSRDAEPLPNVLVLKVASEVSAPLCDVPRPPGTPPSTVSEPEHENEPSKGHSPAAASPATTDRETGEMCPPSELKSATVTVTSHTSHTETFSSKTLSTSNHHEELESDSDISFNQDPEVVIEHQSQHAIQL